MTSPTPAPDAAYIAAQEYIQQLIPAIIKYGDGLRPSVENLAEVIRKHADMHDERVKLLEGQLAEANAQLAFALAANSALADENEKLMQQRDNAFSAGYQTARDVRRGIEDGIREQLAALHPLADMAAGLLAEREQWRAERERLLAILVLARDELERIEQGTAWVDDEVLLKVYAACPTTDNQAALATAGEGRQP